MNSLGLILTATNPQRFAGAPVCHLHECTAVNHQYIDKQTFSTPNNKLTCTDAPTALPLTTGSITQPFCVIVWFCLLACLLQNSPQNKAHKPNNTATLCWLPLPLSATHSVCMTLRELHVPTQSVDNLWPFLGGCFHPTNPLNKNWWKGVLISGHMVQTDHCLTKASYDSVRERCTVRPDFARVA